MDFVPPGTKSWQGALGAAMRLARYFWAKRRKNLPYLEAAHRVSPASPYPDAAKRTSGSIAGKCAL
jgi:hypothetical protein